LGTGQQTLWDWATASARHAEEVFEPRVSGKLVLNELPPAPPKVMFEQIRAARELHLGLELELGKLDLVVTNNRRRMVSTRQRGKHVELRLHHMFIGCDEDVVADLIEFIRGDEPARGRIQRYVRDNRDEIQHSLAREPLRTLGRFHDLEYVLESALELTGRQGCEGIKITWGRRGRGRRSIRLGSYDFDQRLIRIHPALDERWVPNYFLEYVVYHELLHALYPPTMSEDGRRCVHTEEFKVMEERHPRYDDALAWEAANIQHFLDR